MCRTRLAAISGSNTTGTSAVFTRRAPSRRSARFAAMRPISSGTSSRARLRVTWYQPSRCISAPSDATGDTESENDEVSYSPANPWLVA